jgi:hypothetical protein
MVRSAAVGVELAASGGRALERDEGKIRFKKFKKKAVRLSSSAKAN